MEGTKINYKISFQDFQSLDSQQKKEIQHLVNKNTLYRNYIKQNSDDEQEEQSDYYSCQSEVDDDDSPKRVQEEELLQNRYYIENTNNIHLKEYDNKYYCYFCNGKCQQQQHSKCVLCRKYISDRSQFCALHKKKIPSHQCDDCLEIQLSLKNPSLCDNCDGHNQVQSSINNIDNIDIQSVKYKCYNKKFERTCDFATYIQKKKSQLQQQ